MKKDQYVDKDEGTIIAAEEKSGILNERPHLFIKKVVIARDSDSHSFVNGD